MLESENLASGCDILGRLRRRAEGAGKAPEVALHDTAQQGQGRDAGTLSSRFTHLVGYPCHGSPSSGT